MKKILILMAGMSALATNAFAVDYLDAVNDVNMPAGYFSNMDIKKVAVSNTATQITFRIAMNGNTDGGSDWGKYGLFLDTKAGGDTSGNPWARAVGMTSGADYFVGSWVDGGIGSNQLWAFNSGWSQTSQVANNEGSTWVEYTYNISDLGLNLGDTFKFDAWTSGQNGGDSAWDLLSKSSVNDSNNDGVTDWGEATTSSSTLSYTLAVPEPGSLIALGFGALALIRRKK